MRTLPRLWAHSFLLGIAVLSLTGISLSSASLLAQAPKPAASTSNTASGFSIETEMLTYRALESNGEAIACDIAAYLHNATANFKNPPPGMICNVSGSGSNARDGVIVFPFDRTVFADFLIWRSDMQTMAEFEKRGASACTAPAPAPAEQSNKQPGISGRGLTASSTTSAATAVGGVMGALTPAGAMLTTGSGLLSLFASDQATSPVGGTIEDQAFMDDVSRELRAENVPVLMPSVYSPFALTSIDPARSPFLTALDKLLHTRDCLAAGKTSSNDLDVKNIDAFLAALTAAPSAPAAKPATGGAASSSAAPAAGSGSTAAAAPSGPAGPSHLQSALIADGLAQRLGADPQTGLIPADAPQHVLLLKALESGGSVTHSSNIFGGKMSFSGGSVGTYALFDLNGQLECSGNVFDYAGYVSAKDFQKQLHDYKPDPANQVIFNHGGCRAK